MNTLDALFALIVFGTFTALWVFTLLALGDIADAVRESIDRLAKAVQERK